MKTNRMYKRSVFSLVMTLFFAAGIFMAVYPVEAYNDTAARQTANDTMLAFDGDYNTCWQSPNKNDTLIRDLGAVYELTAYKQFFDEQDVWSFALYGSLSQNEWATLADYSYGAAGKTFADSVTGCYRYIKIEFYGSQGGRTANSREFTVDYRQMSEGTNVASGMKGYSGGWAAGFEHEMAFDGDTGSYYCANDANYPQYCGVDWEYNCLVKTIEIRLHDFGSYDFDVIAKTLAGDAITVAPRKVRTGTYFKFDLNGEYANVEYTVYDGPGWANLSEMTVNGFRNLASTKAARRASVTDEGADTVYSLDGLAYIEKVTADGAVSISSDGKEWQATAGAEVRTAAAYVKVAGGAASAIYATNYLRDLAQGIKGAVSDYSNEDFGAKKATMNPEHVDGRNQFWCASFYNGEHWLKLDLGRAAIIERVVQKFQDPGSYKYKIEASLDGVVWTVLDDQTAAAAQGQTFTSFTKANKRLFRYVKLTLIDCGWASSNQLQVFGYGSPVAEHWWQRESGVVRYYPKEQKISIKDITLKLDEHRANGFKVLEIHQPYEGLGDIWSGLGATNNYLADPINGTLDDWKELLDQAHRRGMYVFMFGNVGYARSSAAFFQKACRDYANGVSSKERDWFLFSDKCPDKTKWFWSDVAGAYYYGYWGENGQIPSYNFDSAAWRDQCKKYIDYWAGFGFDGIALDAPPAYYFGSVDVHQTTYENITHVLNAYNIMALPEGTGDTNYVNQYKYSAIQNYNMGGWGGGAWSLGIDAVTDHNAKTIDDFIKGGRDNTVSLGGAAIAPLCFEQKYENVADYKRKAEAALLTTSGHMAFLHAGTSAFVGQDIMQNRSQELKDEVFGLFSLQNSFSGFNAGGMRYRLPTDDDTVYYAYAKGDRDAGIKAFCAFNYAADRKTVTVTLTDSGMGDSFINLLTGEKVTASGGKISLTLGSGGYALLAAI